MFVIVAIIALLLAILYALLIGYFNKGWEKLKIFEADQPQHQSISFSILIPARNEEKNIIDSLNDIIKQDYPLDNFEIIIVDDFSEDDTAERVNEFGSDNPNHKIRLIKLSDEDTNERNSFKKLAITTGIKHSQFDWIITSDADCRHGKNWLSVIAAYIEQKEPVLISAPVAFQNPSNFFERAQALEFLGLIGIGAASISNGSPNLCNGANLVYRKDAFYEIGGFKGVDDLASGDDEFLMHKIYACWPGKIGFLKTKEAIAYTNPSGSLQEFIHQRKRWVSKSRKYTNKQITGILIGAWILHFCLLVCLVGGFFSPQYFGVFICAFGIKVFAEHLFLSKVTRFFNQTKLIRLLIPSAFLYLFYVLFIGIYGNFGKYQWKGRNVR